MERLKIEVAEPRNEIARPDQPPEYQPPAASDHQHAPLMGIRNRSPLITNIAAGDG
jgi:hypothetical protein